MRSPVRFLPLLVTFLCCASASAETRLIFPRLVFQQGRFSGIAVANPTPAGAQITLTAYNPDGSLFSGNGVTNPRVDTIAAGAQYAKVATEIFTPPDSIINSAAAQTVWLEVTSPVDGLTGFFLDGDNGLLFLDGSDLTGSGADLILPRVVDSADATTEVTIVNPDGSGAATVSVELAGEDGSVIRTASVSLPARGAVQGSVAALFPGPFDSVRTMRLRGTKPVACAAFIFRPSENSLVVVGARNAAAPSKILYFPQLAQGGDWSTSVGIVNMLSTQTLVTLTAFTVDGSLFSAPTVKENPVTRSLPAGGSLRTDAKTLFGFADSPLQVGWIKAEASTAAITGYVEYGAGTNRALVAAQVAPTTRAIFSQQANQSPYYTGLAVLNPSSLSANVEVVSLSSTGNSIGKTKRILRPGYREAVLVEQWIRGAAGVVGGSIFLKSDVPVITSQLFGTSTFTALSNVPPQDVPSDFEPGGTSSLRVVPPLAVIETSKTLKFNASGATVSAWGVNGLTPGDPKNGTVSAAGLFSAPSVVPPQHTQTVHASTSSGDQTSAASVDIVQRELLTGSLTQLTAVAYFQNLQRFFTAEQLVLSSEPGSGRAFATTTNTRISEVASSGVATSFTQIPNDTIAKMVPFTDAGGNGFLLLAGYDTGTIYRLSIQNSTQLVTIATGLSQPNSMALDPVSGNLYVSEAGANRVTIIERGRFDSGTSAPSAPGESRPAPVFIALAAAPRGIAFDPCTGALYVSTADGLLRELLENRERQVLGGLDAPGQLLVLLRRGVPSCYEAVTLFVAEKTRVAQIDPRSGEIVSFIEATNEVRDLGYFGKGSPFAKNLEEAIVIGEGPVGVNLSRVLVVSVGGLYQDVPDDSSLSTGLELYPADGAASSNPQDASIAYRDRVGDTFATAATRNAGLYAPDIAAINIHRSGSDNVVSVTVTKPVAPAAQAARNSITGFIDFDTRSGSGLTSHADAYRLLRPGVPEMDAYIDLSTGTLFQLTAAPSGGVAAVTETKVALTFVDKTVTAVFPVSLFDALKSRINVTVGNAVEVTDIAPESRYAFVNPRPSSSITAQFSVASGRGLESQGQVPIEVRLSAASSSTVTVQYAILGGTATGGGVDYTLTSGALSFAPGETVKSISLTVVNDTLDEVDETVVVGLTGGTGVVTSGITTYTYTIVDDDGPPSVQFSVSSASGLESVASVSLSVVLTASSAQTVTVQYAVTGGTATNYSSPNSPGDFNLQPGSLTFAPGETAKSIAVTVNNDTVDEPDETFIVTLANPVNSTLGTIPSMTYTILDDDGAPRVQFSTSASSGSESATSVSFSVVLTAASSQTVTVQYAVTGGTASPPGLQTAEDYSLTPGTLSFAPGETAKTISMTVNNDSVDELDETVIVTLSNPSNSALGSPASLTYTILDDDPPPVIQFTQRSFQGSESVTAASVSVALSTVSGRTVTVQYAATGGTATGGGVDFTLVAGTLTIPAGQTLGTVNFTVVDDPTAEQTETITITLSNPSGATLGTTASTVYSILDNDPLTVQFAVSAAQGSESTANASPTIVLNGVAPSPVTVTWTVSGTATIRSDYIIAGSVLYSTGSITIPAGSSSVSLPLSIVDNTTPEADQTVVVDLSGPVGATLGTSTKYTYLIIDDDFPTMSWSPNNATQGAEGGTYTLTINLSAAPAKTASVSFSIGVYIGPPGSNATYGSDYGVSPAPGTINFAVGQTSATISLRVPVDNLVEGDEYIILQLGKPTNCVLGTATQTFVIPANKT